MDVSAVISCAKFKTANLILLLTGLITPDDRQLTSAVIMCTISDCHQLLFSTLNMSKIFTIVDDRFFFFCLAVCLIAHDTCNDRGK